MSQHLISTKPSCSHCTHCGRPTLCGLDAGVSYTVDLVPLNLTGELHARLNGHTTYWVDAGMVMYRSLADINAGITHPTLTEHSCDPINPDHIHPGHAAAMTRYLTPHDVADPDALSLMIRDGGFMPPDATPPF